MSTSHLKRPTTHATDFDLHGLVGIRLLDASPSDVAAVRRQLGPIQAPLGREPDILIRFVDRLPSSPPMRCVGVDDAWFTDDVFLVLGSKHKTTLKVQIPFEQIGQQCEIVCERGLPLVPLLIPILNLTVLSKGAIPLHASAFTYNGIGIIATGWPHGSKTGALLAFMDKGAKYIGDDWIYLKKDGSHMYGLPQSITVRHWYLRDLPRYRARVGRGDRARLRSIKALTWLMHLAMNRNAGSRIPPPRGLSRIVQALNQRLSVDLTPHELFAPASCELAGTLEKVFLVISHKASDVTVESISPREAARRLVFSFQHEQVSLMAYYLKFRFAFAELRNEFIERSEEIHREMLLTALANKETYVVYHPYPVSAPDMFNAISPLLYA
jgi:hypothetical protein